jgi:integrase
VSVREPRRLPVVLSPEAVSRLLASTTNIKHKAALSLTYATGLRSSEVVSLKLTDIDSDRMVIRVEQGKSLPQRRLGAGRIDMSCSRPTFSGYCANGGTPRAKGIDASRPALAVPRLPRAAYEYAPTPPHRSPRSGACRHHQTRRCSYAAAQLCHASAGAKDRYPRHSEPAPAKAGVLLGHKKLDTTALYTRVAIKAIGEVTSPLDLLLSEAEPPA